MTQTELDRHIARITGESVATIRQRGFTTLRPIPSEPDHRPLTVDWDEINSERKLSFPAKC